MTRFCGLLLNTGLEKSNEEETELAKRDLENKLALDSQITMEEEEYKTMQNVHKQVVTTPMSTLNAIAIEAYKKYILVSLIHLGQTCSL
ncbi:PREDICTED: COP9 signalosome complex subunit 3-like [Ipomoea nil]|uniref:COP9 signalosome complex subunit 3-like n=1 Tax=Ipomoea nil TaxID=35883 RepID=UPI00090132A2|nr:PREDICTED: COP9 signalosome complex subunit 3-like [Ipomoea nil]